MISFQQILYVLVFISLLVVLLAGKKKLQVGMFIATLLLATGYRRVFLSKYLEIHPAEVLFWFVAIVLVLQRRSKTGEEQKFRMPRWLVFFMFCWVWGWSISLVSKLPLDLILNQFKPFLILPLIIWLVWKLTQENNGFYTLLYAMFFAGTLIGALGIVEYYLPGMVAGIPGFSANPFSTADYMGFVRATFSFFGAPTATFMLAITAPLSLALWHRANTLNQKINLISGVIVQILGIYIGGYRSIWLALGVEIILFVMLYRGVFVGILGLIPLVLAYRSLPNEALVRLSTLLAVAQGSSVDSSAIKRIERINEAYAVLKQNPFGLGWGGSGWTHNDLLQIAVDLGVIAAIIFIIGYGVLFFHLIRKVLFLRNMRARSSFQVSLGLLLGFIGSGFLYISQGVTWQVFLVLPAWLIWAVAHYWVAEPPIVNLQENTNVAENIRFAPRFQQRRYDPRNSRIHPLDRRGSGS
jgi:hypothetical protein